VVAVVGRWFATLPRIAGAALASFDWLDTTVALPAGVYRDVFTEMSHTVEEGAGVRVAELLARFPVALLVAEVT
jgi:maltooligosyltrehalose synthase